MSQLQNLSATINKLDREANAGKSASYFQIAELSYNSPVRVVIEPHAIARQSYMGHLVLENLGKIADALVSDSDLHSIDYDTVKPKASHIAHHDLHSDEARRVFFTDLP